MQELKSPFEGHKAYKIGSLTVLISKDANKWHISISHPTRYPKWDEMKSIKYKFFPNIEMAMFFPKQGDFVNVHPNCFHLFEV